MARRTTSTPPVLPGYRFVRPLGAGGFADVFLYEQEMPRRTVAVKVLLADAINPEVLRQFTAEADAMARLSSHPSILSIYQASFASDGRPFFVMEFCPDSYGARYRQGVLSVFDVLDVGVRIAAALETAHRAGMLHRDIKPSNILITSLGTAVLADFGIASSIRVADEADELIAMSIPWSSPEVIGEQTAGTVASEVWALGATLYTLLAGRSPFAFEDRARNSREAITGRILKAQYTPLGRADVPRPVENLLERMMSRDPAKRPVSMLAVAEELRWVQFELGQSPTSLEIAELGWAAESPDYVAPSDRGPVLTTVNKNSRRAKRAAAATSSGPGADDELEAGPRRSSALVGIVAAAVGVVVIGVIAVVVLAAIGVF